MSITPETWDRIASAVRTVEGQAVNESSRPVSYTRTSAPPVVRVQVTGPVDGTSGYYPCTFQTRDPSANPAVWTPLGAGWAEGFNGESLSTNVYYGGVLEGVFSDGVPVVQVFVGSMGGNTVVRLTTGSADANGLYTAKIQTVNIAGLPRPFTDGANCYWYDANDLLTLNTLLTAYFVGTMIGSSGGLPVFSNADFNLGVNDAYANSNAWDINQLDFSSPGSVISNDWTITTSGRVEAIAHHGLTISVQYCDTDGMIHTLKFENGLLKARS